MDLKQNTQHIGIVACSAEGASLCYRTICNEGSKILGPHGHPEISLHTHSLAEYVKYLDNNDMQGVANLMCSSADKLEKAGADFLICPDNTIHQAFQHIPHKSSLPWIHIAEVVAAQASQRGFNRLGITGTHWLTQSDIYPEKLAHHGLEFVRPETSASKEIGRIIMEELVNGIFNPRSIAYFQNVIEWMKNKNCDAVILGCTEIPLIINDHNSTLPTLDSTRLLARAALQKATNKIANGE
ncbi:aspartate/glutamate racemase family protein [Aliikangiella coralliicola]|uniref:Amino acid racemase n=1 Tax=Aliikangiella coralliicola TaxID=2592383 RepID=A0A545UCC9_9GAMM|nr:amino acid racemase [Aliikangiella coralliicola]TQV87117.1 amino acid racemase [Aliikangiella coralliicola]